jgi:Site-specific recombinase XerD
LEWRRVDWEASLLHLEGKDTKSGKRRSIPLNRDARLALQSRFSFAKQYCADSRWVFARKDGERIQGVKRGFAIALRKAGITDFRIHDLRHTCASWLVSAGVPLPAVRDLLGHSTVKMTERYAHLAPENVRAAVDVLDAVSRKGHAGNEKALAEVS